MLKVLSGLPCTDFWKKIPPKIDLDFQPKITNFSKGIVWRKKFAELATLKFWNKIECTHPVKYVEANMARSCRLTWLKIEDNSLLK